MKTFVLHTKDLMRMEQISYSTALRRMKLIKSSFGSKEKFITLIQYASFTGLSMEEVERMADGG